MNFNYILFFAIFILSCKKMELIWYFSFIIRLLCLWGRSVFYVVEPVSLLEGVGGGWGVLTLLLIYWLPSFWDFHHIFILLTLCVKEKGLFSPVCEKINFLTFCWHLYSVAVWSSVLLWKIATLDAFKGALY